MHGPQHPIAGIHQDHLAMGDVELFEIALQGMAHELDQGAGQFAARGATTHHHGRLQKSAPGWVGSLLSLFEGHQHAPANLIGVLKDLHRWR